MKKKSDKKSDKNKWIKFSKHLREQQRHCSVCGKKEHLNVHHILSWKNYKQYRFDVNNLLVVCAGCHTFSRLNFESNALWAASWLQQNRPEQYEWCMERL